MHDAPGADASAPGSPGEHGPRRGSIRAGAGLSRWVLAASAGTAAVGLLAFFALAVPRFDHPAATVLLDRDGVLLQARVAADGQWRFPGVGTVPTKYARALIAWEDKRFRSHPGVDPLAVLRAARDNAASGRVVSGASTLTMQVVRMARGNRPRTFAEKAREAVLALRLEAARSKGEILALYADHAPLGGNTVGLEAAAWRYFGRGPESLSWAEGALLAVLPNRPGEIHPGRNRDALRARRDAVLGRLARDGALSPVDLAAAVAEPLPGAPGPLPTRASHLAARVAGERVRTTLDGTLQVRASEVVARHARTLAGSGIYNAAALVADLETGEILAYVGNAPAGPGHGQEVDAVQAPRSTGSLLKPFLYAAMLEEGEILPRQLVADVPGRIGGFAPENFDRRYLGALPADGSLARSRNVPAVRMLRDHGVARFTARLRQLGMTTLFRPAEDYGLSLVVGGAEGTLLETTGLFRDLALSALRPEGSLPPALHWRAGAAGPARTARWDPAAAWLTVKALIEVSRPGLESSWRAFAEPRPVAWKTGTSQGFRDAWAIGATTRHAVGVWVGNVDGVGSPGLTGHEAAAPLLFEILDLLPPGADFPRPDLGGAPVTTCARSGQLAGPDCEVREETWAPRAGARAPSCRACRVVHLDAAGTARVHAGCAPASDLREVRRFVLPAAQEAFYAREHPEYRPLPPWRHGCQPAGEAPSLAVLAPAPGAAFFVPVELDGERGRVVFQAAHRTPGAEVHWHLDGGYLGTTRAPHDMALAPPPGAHRLVVVDEWGERVERGFRVLGEEREDGPARPQSRGGVR